MFMIKDSTKYYNFNHKNFNFLFFWMLIFGFVFIAYGYDESFDGGPARLAAMGKQEIVVEDNATIIDLNNLGFTSAILTRPAQSIIYLNPELDLMTSRYVTNGITIDQMIYYGIGTGTSGAINNGLLFFFSKDTALIIKPMLSISPGIENLSGVKYDYLYFIPSGELSIAQRLGDNFSIALTGGYINQSYNENIPNGNENDYSFGKIEYELSFSMLSTMSNDWSFGLSIGNKTKSLLLSPLTEIHMNIFNDSGLISSTASMFLFNTGTYTKTPSGEETYDDYTTNGLNISLGAASGKSGDIQVDARAGLLTNIEFDENYKNIESGTTVDQTTSKIFINGIGANSELNFRIKLNDKVNLGLKGVFNFITYETQLNMEDYLLNGKGVAGINIGNKGFMIPCEFFYEILQAESKGHGLDVINSTYDFGIRLGNEIELNNNFSIRFGLDYALVGDYGKSMTNGLVISETSPAGSAKNPWGIQLGYNAGIGFKNQTNEFNIGIRIEPQWESPVYAGANQYNFVLITDMKFYL